MSLAGNELPKTDLSHKSRDRLQRPLAPPQCRPREAGEGESFGVRDNRIEVLCRKRIVHTTEVFATQGGRRIRKMDDAIKSAWPSQDRGIEDSRFIGPWQW